MRPLSQVEVEVQITSNLRRLEELTEHYSIQREHAAVTDAEYKRVYHRAFLMNEGTVAEREAKAMRACEDQYAARKIADAVADSTKEAMHSCRDALSALQSLLRSIALQT